MPSRLRLLEETLAEADGRVREMGHHRGPWARDRKRRCWAAECLNCRAVVSVQPYNAAGIPIAGAAFTSPCRGPRDASPHP